MEDFVSQTLALTSYFAAEVTNPATLWLVLIQMQSRLESREGLTVRSTIIFSLFKSALKTILVGYVFFSKTTTNKGGFKLQEKKITYSFNKLYPAQGNSDWKWMFLLCAPLFFVFYKRTAHSSRPQESVWQGDFGTQGLGNCDIWPGLSPTIERTCILHLHEGMPRSLAQISQDITFCLILFIPATTMETYLQEKRD